MKRISIPEDLVFRDLDGEAVILNLNTGIYFGLDGVGTRLWHLLAEHGNTEKVIAAILEEFEVTEADVRRDVDRFLQDLEAKGLLVVDAPKTA